MDIFRTLEQGLAQVQQQAQSFVQTNVTDPLVKIVGGSSNLTPQQVAQGQVPQSQGIAAPSAPASYTARAQDAGDSGMGALKAALPIIIAVGAILILMPSRSRR